MRTIMMVTMLVLLAGCAGGDGIIPGYTQAQTDDACRRMWAADLAKEPRDEVVQVITGAKRGLSDARALGIEPGVAMLRMAPMQPMALDVLDRCIEIFEAADISEILAWEGPALSADPTVRHYSSSKGWTDEADDPVLQPTW